jgi:hypothetical protein
MVVVADCADWSISLVAKASASDAGRFPLSTEVQMGFKQGDRMIIILGSN